MRLEIFFAGMRAARAELGPGRHRFLEVGSGLGTKLALAHTLGFDAEGIERYEDYLDVCHRVFPHLKAQIGDIESFDRYGEFDLVYVARPATDPAYQVQINERIIEAMRPGALLFLVYCRPPEGCEQVAENVYKVPEGVQEPV